MQLPGKFVKFKLVTYMDIEQSSDLYSYNPIEVNGINNAKIHIFKKEVPSYIKIGSNS